MAAIGRIAEMLRQAADEAEGLAAKNAEMARLKAAIWNDTKEHSAMSTVALAEAHRADSEMVDRYEATLSAERQKMVDMRETIQRHAEESSRTYDSTYGSDHEGRMDALFALMDALEMTKTTR